MFLSQTLFFFVFFRFLYDKLFIISSSALILLSSFSVYSFYIPFSSVVFQFFFGKLFVIFSTQFPFSIIFSSCFSVYSFCIAVSSFLPRFFFNKLHFFLVTFFLWSSSIIAISSLSQCFAEIFFFFLQIMTFCSSFSSFISFSSFNPSLINFS